MKIIIVGCGKVGRTLAEQLCRENHDVTVIDHNEGALQYVADNLDALCVVGKARKMNEIASQLLKKEPNLFLSVKAIPGEWY